MGLMRSSGMGTRAGISFPLKLNDSYRRPSYSKQDVSSIGPISTVGHVYSVSSNGSLPGKRWNLKCSRPICGRPCVIPCGAGRSASVNKSKAITGGLQVTIQMSSTALDMGCTVMVMAGAYILVSTFDALTESKILDQKLSRKLVHILSGLLFMMSWPLFRVLYYFSIFGFILLDWATVIQSVAIISMSATIVESLPVTQLLDDNISVPLTSIFVGLFLFPA